MAGDDTGSAWEVVNTRLFQAPRDAVFQAFSDPAQLPGWWGPRGFINTFQEFDFRPGGHWSLEMRAPNGSTFQNESDFLEIVPPERIAFHHVKPMHPFLMTMTFAEEGEATRVTWRMRFESQAEYDRAKQFVGSANEENFDRLAEHLTSLRNEG